MRKELEDGTALEAEYRGDAVFLTATFPDGSTDSAEITRRQWYHAFDLEDACTTHIGAAK